jgi:hypothetical protein
MGIVGNGKADGGSGFELKCQIFCQEINFWVVGTSIKRASSLYRLMLHLTSSHTAIDLLASCQDVALTLGRVSAWVRQSSQECVGELQQRKDNTHSDFGNCQFCHGNAS